MVQILKHQLGALAEEAAALISRGDSLVYARHARSPLLADFLQARVQDRLRAKWAAVLAEIEAKRNVAIQAEDHVKELQRLLERLGPVEKISEVDAVELAEREGDIERVQELCRELRTARVAYPERAATDVCAAWTRARSAPNDNKTKVVRCSQTLPKVYYFIYQADVDVFFSSRTA